MQSIIDARQTSTDAKLEQLDGWLSQMHTGGLQNNADYKYGVTAHSFVESDGSAGFHNFPYAQAVLGHAINKVDGYGFLYLPVYLRPQ